MSQSTEAKVYHTLRNINDLTKANITQAIIDANSAGTLTLDEYTIRNVSNLVGNVIDQMTDTVHNQIVHVVNEAETTRKKPTGRKSK